MNFKRLKKRFALAIIICVLIDNRCLAFTDGSGWAQVGYLIKILEENYRRYAQLKQMIDISKGGNDYMRILNSGLENSIGLLSSLPIQDNHVLSDITEFRVALEKVQTLYGKIPKSSEQALQEANDQTVAESLRMSTDFKKYSEDQEKNSNLILDQVRGASPKGAERMQAETSAEILKSLSQLLRLNTQILKMQSESLAMTNKASKESVGNFQKVSNDLGTGFSHYKLETKLLRF